MSNATDIRSDIECLDDMLPDLVDLEVEIDAMSPSCDDVNVFEVLGITNTEIRHSNVIAWLMRPDGSHGVGDTILSAIIKYAGGQPASDMSDFRIMRESDNIDILAVSAGNRTVLAVENKIWSGEHDNQLARYQGIIEQRYPGWEHLYLFLSPTGTPPQNDDDREVWITIDYRTLLGMIESAVAESDISDKARMLIGDYVDSVRRHIVGNESLQERCVEIYLRHKRAIDLIVSNLPDTSKVVHQYALDWASRQEGLDLVGECSHGKSYVRFRTRTLEEWFPGLEARDAWGQCHFWFYEIETRVPKSGVGCLLKFQLSFYVPKKGTFPLERAEAARTFVAAFAGDSAGTFYGMYSGCVSPTVAFDPRQVSYEDVSAACGELWSGFLAREERAIAEVFG